MINPEYILEIGTFTGYSAICLAEGLQEGGKLITIDTNPETTELCMEYVTNMHLTEKIETYVGKAADIIPNLSMSFDLVFIDADKTNYSTYFDLVIDKVKSGGYILADNVLYHGDVVDMEKAGKNAKAMHAYNEKINQDIRIESVLLPLRDGIMISRKK
jgi:predicted O-methyltransferase YrrM